MAIRHSYKASLQRFLVRVGLYERLKSSRLYDVYWRMVNPQIITDRSREVEFYRRTLEGFTTGNLIFDIGANQGYKADIFLRLGARVVAVEPDETNQEKLRRTFLERRLAPRPVHIVGKAVSDGNGVTTMWVDAPGSAKNTLSGKWVTTLRDDDRRFGTRLDFGDSKRVETTTVEDLIEAHGVPFFIKIDVEGHEPSVLRGMKRPVPYVSFEVNLPEFVSEGLQCINRLNEIAGNGEFNYTSDSRTGLALEKWVPHGEFIGLFGMISESSIEVYWRTPMAR